MTISPANLINNGTLDLARLASLAALPPPWEPGEPHFWTDPHIARQMLRFHLDPTTEAASRKPALIDTMIAWMVRRLGVESGAAWLDLGCGPGLYTWRLAERGLDVTGLDFSANSLAYAREHDPASRYVQANYTALDVDALDLRGKFDVITLIYGDFNVLDDSARVALLANVRAMLKPGGALVMDVSTRAMHTRTFEPMTWGVHLEGGFFSAEPHLLLSGSLDYPEDEIQAEQYIVINAAGRARTFRIWNRAYTPESLTALLEAHGFSVEDIYGDLTGSAFNPDGEYIGVVARLA